MTGRREAAAHALARGVVVVLAAAALLAGCASRDEGRMALRFGADRAARALLDSLAPGRAGRAADPSWTAAGVSRDGRVAWWAGAFDAPQGEPNAPGRHVTLVLSREGNGGWVPLVWHSAPAPVRALGAPMPDPERPQAAAGGDSLAGKRAARVARQLRRDLGRIGRAQAAREAIVIGPFAGMRAFGRTPSRELLGDLARDWSALQIGADRVHVVHIPETRSAWVRADILGIYAGSGVSREVPLTLFAVYQQSDEDWRLALLHLAREEPAQAASAPPKPAPRRRAGAGR